MSTKFRTVSDAEFDRVLADPDLVKVANNFVKKNRYRKFFSPEDFQSVWLRAFWKFAGYHVDGMGQKPTTNICWHIRNEFLRELDELDRHKMERLPPEWDMPVQNEVSGAHSMTHARGQRIRKAMGCLSTYSRDLIDRYYMGEQSVEEIAAALNKPRSDVVADVRVAVETLKSVCEQQGSICKP